MKYSNISKQAVVIATAIAMVYLVGSAMNNLSKDEATGTEASYFPPAELATIRTAAIRNGIQPGTENWRRLLAIRKSEDGRKGREFGIIHPRCDAEMAKRPNETMDIQAGWCAASIVKSEARWIKAGKPGDFIDFMGKRYCDPEDHPLNKHWAGNVRAWVKKLGGAK